MIRIIIMGMCGQMGQNILSLAMSRKQEFTVSAGVDLMPKENAYGIPVYPDIFSVTEEADVIIDFSRPSALPNVLEYAKQHHLRAVIGTTGLSESDRELMDHYASSVPIFHSGNFSLGVNLQIDLTKRAAATLGENFDVEIIEKHHHFKVDAPSGTALMLADGISSQYPTERKYTFGRYTKTERRKPNEIGFHSVRGGTIVGEHEVLFIGQDEIVEINHRAYSKQVFAAGALRGAAFIMQKSPGIYTMQDVVMEKDVLSHLYTVDDQAVVTVCGLSGTSSALSRIFGAIAKKAVNVDMISNVVSGGGNMSISFSLAAKHLESVLQELEALKASFPEMRVSAMTGVTKFTVEGSGMEFRHGVAAQIFEVLANANIEIILVTTSETKIAFCIENSQVPLAVRTMAEELDL